MSLVGRLEDLALSDIFQILSIGKKTGTLSIRSDKGSAFIVFKNGLIVRAETDMIEGNIGYDLVKGNIVKEKILNMAVEVKKSLPQKSIAEIIFELGSANKDLLDRVAKKRIEEVIYHLLLLDHGEFRFELDNLDVSKRTEFYDTGWEVSKGISAEYLLMEGARVQDEKMHKEYLEEGIADEEGPEAWEEDWTAHPAVTERKDISALKALTQELRFPDSPSEITLLILRFASDMFQRGVLFMVGEDDFTGLGQFGLEIEGADEKIRETILSYRKSPFLRGITENRQPFRGTLERDAVTELLIRELGGEWPSEVALFPIIAEGRVIAMLYCDNASAYEGIPETEGLEIFVNQAGMALEKSLLQKKLQEIQKGIKP
ncbi:MAG: hypothetical protein OHK0032_09750 [Thermodesulfovibrionales bacterium]